MGPQWCFHSRRDTCICTPPPAVGLLKRTRPGGGGRGGIVRVNAAERCLCQGETLVSALEGPRASSPLHRGPSPLRLSARMRDKVVFCLDQPLLPCAPLFYGSVVGMGEVSEDARLFHISDFLSAAVPLTLAPVTLPECTAALTGVKMLVCLWAEYPVSARL